LTPTKTSTHEAKNVIGLSNKGNIPATDPLYDKKYFEDQIDKRTKNNWHGSRPT
jgi:hypothetical protein